MFATWIEDLPRSFVVLLQSLKREFYWHIFWRVWKQKIARYPIQIGQCAAMSW